MQISRRIYIILIFFMGVVPSGCSEKHNTNQATSVSKTPASSLHVTKQASQDVQSVLNYHITWINDKVVLISSMQNDKNWLYSFPHKKLVKLPDRSSHSEASPSPSGKYVFADNWTLDDKLSLATISSDKILDSIKNYDIPPMPTKDPDEVKTQSKLAAWTPDENIYVEHFNIRSGRHQCQIFHIKTKTWVSINKCMHFVGIGGEASSIDYLGNNLYVVFYSGEGEVSVRFNIWSAKQGYKETSYPDLTLGMYPDIHFYLNKISSELYALSSVPLAKNQAQADLYKDYSKEQSVLYHWTKDAGFIPSDIKLNPYVALYNIASKKTAWLNSTGTEICLGELNKQSQCFPIELY